MAESTVHDIPSVYEPSLFGTYSITRLEFKIMSRFRTGLTFSQPISLLKRPRREMSCLRCFSSCLLSFSQGKRGRTITPAIIYLALSSRKRAANLTSSSSTSAFLSHSL